MQIHKQKNKRKYIIIATLLVLLLAGAATANFLYTRDSDKPNSKAQSDIDQASNLAKEPENKSLSPNSDQPLAPTGTDTSTKKSIQMVASANVTNETLYIRGGLNYPEPEQGTCYAELSGPTGRTIRKDTEILQNPASADCKTVSIPVSELTPGTWKSTLKYTSANYEGTSNEVETTIN